MQQSKPTNATGVKVVLSVIDPNNNAYEVGTATSDANGKYQMTFTPQVPGEYTLIATFPGSTSYYGSSAETAFVVEDAPTPSPIAETIKLPPTEMYFVASTVAIILAIAIVGLLLLRKRLDIIRSNQLYSLFIFLNAFAPDRLTLGIVQLFCV